MMPQVGERWRLRIREGEALCPHCGYDSGSWKSDDGKVVSILNNDTQMRCVGCLRIIPADGWYGISTTSRLGHTRAVPYTWLEPVQ